MNRRTEMLTKVGEIKTFNHTHMDRLYYALNDLYNDTAIEGLQTDAQMIIRGKHYDYPQSLKSALWLLHTQKENAERALSIVEDIIECQLKEDKEST